MAIRLEKINVDAGEMIFVNIQGSAERNIVIQVGRNGRCYISAPFNTNMKVFELTIGGMRETDTRERDDVLSSP